MGTLKLTIWELLIGAMTLTSVAALIALVLSMMLARLLTSLMLSDALVHRPKRNGIDKTLRCFDQLFTCALANRSYYN